MGIEYIQKATCDICGKECSHYREMVVKEEDCKEYSLKQKLFVNNVYSYTKMILQGFDNRFECGKNEYILCGKCLEKLGEWLKENKK